QIRSLRGQLESLRKRLADQAQYKVLVAASDDLDHKMAAVEEDLLQVKSKSNEDPLNYPIRVSEKLMALHKPVQSADTAPTQQAYEVFQDLSSRVEQQLSKWRQLVSKDLASLNDLMRKENVSVLMVTAPKLESAPAP